jgi:hypothetical protein
MAQKTIVQLVDDMTGDVMAEGDGETVEFAVDGQVYEIDVKATEAAKLRKALTKYMEHGRSVKARIVREGNVSTLRRGGNGNTRRASTDKEQLKAVREWANNNGFTVAERGRIPQTVIDAYHAATG